MILENADKQQIQKQWNATPCGTGDYLDGFEPESLEWFDAVRKSRYEVTDDWMPRTIDFSVADGKKLLEIGHGMGSDLLTFCENGAEVFGIDITEEHHRLTKKNFELHGKKCTLKLCDAANIDFPSDTFDVVYSNGVLHHTPDTVRCISEAYRVLKPGGLLIMNLYYTFSAFHLYTKLLYDGILKGKLFRLRYRGLMATLEYGADGVDISPLVKTYSKHQLKYVLEDFSNVKFKIAHFKPNHLPGLGFLLPRFAERLLEPVLGWYVVSFCRK